MIKLERALMPVRRRIRQKRTCGWMLYGLCLGAVCALLLRAASFLWPFPTMALWSVTAVAGMPLFFAAAGWLWPVSVSDAARKADSLGLQARAQTALMLKDANSPMAELQRQDTLCCLEGLDAKRAMPIRAPKLVMLFCAGCAAVFALSFLIPNLQINLLREKAEFQTRMEEQAELIEKGASKLNEADEETPELRKLLGDLARELRLSDEPKEALAALDQTEREMAELEKRAAAKALQALDNAGQSKLAQALEQGNEEAARAEMEGQEEKSLAEALSEASKNAGDTAASEALAKAAAAMQSGNIPQALSNLKAAASGQCNAAAKAAALSGMARAAVARAGTQMSASLQLAAGNQAGQGASSSAGKGAGTGGAGGTGSSDKDGGYKAASSASVGQGTRPPEKKVAQYEAIYDPTRLGGDGEMTNERGQIGKGEVAEATIGAGVGSIDQSVHYNEVLVEYQQSAVQAAQSAELPAYAQKWIESYFGSLAE